MSAEAPSPISTPITLLVPILPGKHERWRRFVQELLGSRRVEHAATRQQLGIIREVAWLHCTARGALVQFCIEACDPGQVRLAFATADGSFDRWLKKQLLELHGLDLSETTTELVYEWLSPERR